MCRSLSLSFFLSLSLSLSASPLTSVRISAWRYSIITRSVLLVVAEISDRGKGKAGKRGLQNTRIFAPPSRLPAHEFHAVRVSYQCTTITTTTVSFALCVSVWIIIFGYTRIIVFGYCDQRSSSRPASQPIARLRPEIVIPPGELCPSESPVSERKRGNGASLRQLPRRSFTSPGKRSLGIRIDEWEFIRFKFIPVGITCYDITPACTTIVRRMALQ